MTTNAEQTNAPLFAVSLASAADLRPIVDLEEAVSMQKYPKPMLGITPQDIAAIGWGEERVAKYRERFLENPNAALRRWSFTSGTAIRRLGGSF